MTRKERLVSYPKRRDQRQTPKVPRPAPLSGQRFYEEPVSRINFDVDLLAGAATEGLRQEF